MLMKGRNRNSFFFFSFIISMSLRSTASISLWVHPSGRSEAWCWITVFSHVGIIEASRMSARVGFYGGRCFLLLSRNPNGHFIVFLLSWREQACSTIETIRCFVLWMDLHINFSWCSFFLLKIKKCPQSQDIQHGACFLFVCSTLPQTTGLMDSLNIFVWLIKFT